MSQPYLGEIRIVAFNFPPKGWAFCNGQTLPINQNQALFALVGTFYGGNGSTTFQLPNLQGRSALGVTGTSNQGQSGGEAFHTLTTSEMPSHTHQAFVSTGGGVHAASGNLVGVNSAALFDPTATANVGMAPVLSTVGGQPHENRMPFLTINYIVALQGIFPSRN